MPQIDTPPPLEHSDSAVHQSTTNTGIKFGLINKSRFIANTALNNNDNIEHTDNNDSLQSTTTIDNKQYIIPLKKHRTTELTDIIQSEPTGERIKLEFESTRDVNTRTAETSNKPGNNVDTNNQPLLMRNKHNTDSTMSDTDRYKHDIHQYTDTSANYTAVPISAFGTAMLRGMGWSEGKPIGGSTKAVVEPITWKRRNERVGLGADNNNNTTDNNSGINDMLHSTSAYAMKQLQQSGRIIQLDVQQLHNNALIEVATGQYIGEYGRVVSINNNTATVKLNTVEDTVIFARDELVVLDERALPLDHPALHTQQQDDQSFAKIHIDTTETLHTDKSTDESKTTTMHDNNDHTNTLTTSSNGATLKRTSDTVDERERKRLKHIKPITWAREQLIVRIVNKHIYNGTLYNEKAVILQITSSTTMTVKLLSNQQIVTNITEYDIETVIPKIDGTAMILNGEYKTQLCTVVERNNKRNMF